MSAQPLGAILAGGASRRFGSDKALAAIDGEAMLDRVARRLTPQCAALVVAGRDWPGLVRVDDRPLPGLGPLGGLAGALAYGAARGYAQVLTAACDLPDLPPDLLRLLGGADGLLADQPTIGLWQTIHAGPLCDWLAGGGDRSIRQWSRHIGARAVAGPAITNINRPAELAAFSPPVDRRSSR